MKRILFLVLFAVTFNPAKAEEQEKSQQQQFCVSDRQHLPSWEYDSKSKRFDYVQRPFFTFCEEVPHYGRA